MELAVLLVCGCKSVSLIVASQKSTKTLTFCARALFFYSWHTVCPQTFSSVVANVTLSGSIKPYLQISGWCFQLVTVCCTVCFGFVKSIAHLIKQTGKAMEVQSSCGRRFDCRESKVSLRNSTRW